MKRWISATTAAALVMMTTAPMAIAATAAQTSTQIVINNDTIAAPHVVSDGGAQYVPIWYVMQALKHAGVTSTWNDNTWYLSTGSSVTPKPATSMQGDTEIHVMLNGQALGQYKRLVALDPSSHKMTNYMRESDVATILKQLNLSVSENGSTFGIQTADAASLEETFQNTESAPSYQISGTLSEKIHLDMTSQAKTSTSSQPKDMTIQMNFTSQTGTVNGEKAQYVSMTPVSSTTSTQGASIPSMQEYIQGSKVYLNTGSGWKENANAEQLIASIKSQLPTQNLNYSILHDIQATHAGDKITYQAKVDGMSLEKMIMPIVQSIVASNGSSSSVSQTTLQSVIETMLKNMNISAEIDTQTVSGKRLITDEQMTVDMNLPMAQLAKLAASGKSTSVSGLSSLTLHETVNAAYTYDAKAVTPPSGLPTSSSN